MCGLKYTYVCKRICVVCVCDNTCLYGRTCTRAQLHVYCVLWHFRFAQRFNVIMRIGNCLMQ